MRSYQWQLISFLLFVGGWGCLFSAVMSVPVLPGSIGLSPEVIYTVALVIIGFLAVVCACAGIFISIILKFRSFGMRMAVFWLSNFLLFFAALLGVFVIVAYVLDTLFGVAGICLFAGMIVSTIAAAPKRI